ncbi:regulator of G-protein signaling 5-like [Genypterus blacodes]|uniref:regulator of G-protein signaling 5-like n=1 Tax=Genypterus blacodes TaxID=154954 RepID=UPI003F77555A
MCKGLATLPATCLKGAIDIKHKISVLLQKSEHPVADEKPVKVKSDAPAKSVKDIKQNANKTINKIGVLLQKSDHPVADQKTAKAVKSGPTAAEVEKWRESFSSVINSEGGCVVFSSFLKSEFSEENIEFWAACQDYKRAPVTKMATKARQIYQQYVAVDSPNEVNLDAETREQTKQNLEGACMGCFDEAQRKIYMLMEKDSYRRFLNSKLLQDISQTCNPIMKDKDASRNSCNGYKQVFAGGA